MTKWEYKVTDVAGDEYEDIQETLNRFGAEGWELVCTTETEESVCTLWLKRQKWWAAAQARVSRAYCMPVILNPYG